MTNIWNNEIWEKPEIENKREELGWMKGFKVESRDMMLS